MRLALNGWFYVYTSYTGTGQYVRALVEWLPKVAPQHDYVLVAPQRGLPAPTGWRVVEAPCRDSDLDKVRFEQLLFPQACRAEKADLAHIPYWAPPLSCSVPFVVTVHDLIPLLLPEYRGGPLVRLYTALVTAATPGAAHIFADSEATRADTLKQFTLPAERVTAVPLGVDPRYTAVVNDWQADEQTRAKYNLPEAYVLYLGGFDARKNVRALLAAWTWAVGPVGESYPLVLGGALPKPDGRLFEDYQTVTRELNIANTVHFIGAVAEEDKPAVYRGAGAFVYPSRYEGFGLPPLEAMACGVPVLTTNNGSIGEVVGDSAFLIDTDDTRKFGAAIITCLVEPTVSDHLKARGLTRAKKFTWEKTAREVVKVYENVKSET